jgi:hypothetical protein
MRHGSTLVALVGLSLGFVACSSALAGVPPLPDEARGTRVAPLLLLSRPDVRAELNLSPEQAADAEKAIEDLHQKAVAIKGRKDKAAIELRRLVDEGQKQFLDEKLTPDQRDRLLQVDLRWEGPAALTTRKAIADSLALTEAQLTALKRAVHDRDAQRDSGQDPAIADRLLTTRALGILTDDQKRMWDRMLGKPLTGKPASASAGASQASR